MPHDPDLAVWLAAPQQHLLQLTAGDVFRDDPGELTRRRRTYRPYPKCFGHGFAALPVSGSLGPLLDEALADPPVQRRDGPLQQALQQLAAAHNDLHVSESVEPLIGYFELGVNDATRPYPVLNTAAFIEATVSSIVDDRVRNLPRVGTLDQLTHAADQLINFTSWPFSLADIYRRMLSTPP